MPPLALRVGVTGQGFRAGEEGAAPLDPSPLAQGQQHPARAPPEPREKELTYTGTSPPCEWQRQG